MTDQRLAELEKDVLDWEKLERDTESDLHRFFAALASPSWIEVSDEALRLWNAMFSDDVERDSPVHNMLSAVAAAGADTAYAAIERAFGLPVGSAPHILDEFLYNGRTAPLAPDELKRALAHWNG